MKRQYRDTFIYLLKQALKQTNGYIQSKDR